ncbi:minor capsid protein [Enterococcus casseliflavus]|uniref:minor capsid protein n=1 Tax=Enterococcus sp. 8E11_MSG4843 TaxID=1834190 RepID=UPI000B3EB972|nr:minor capsid protein [Enterococcus sp. 8E11_MSG4843]MBO1095593.1 minor capsid protein [Enterococcus casseliflavus]MBO1144106.1 minor capsid protein [Enterococcus casseliflavus]OUZ34434.1 hypothetical protein A5885_002165 [Enterococcus sp. 8E11_MSG4843]
MSGIKIEIDLGGVRSKLSEDNLGLGQLNMANRMLQTMNETVVPWDTMHLRDTGHVSGRGSQLVFDAPYAGPQYYGGRKHPVTGVWIPFVNKQPGTGPFWDEAAKPLFMSDWLQAFKIGAKL